MYQSILKDIANTIDHAPLALDIPIPKKITYIKIKAESKLKCFNRFTSSILALVSISTFKSGLLKSKEF